MKLGLRAPIWTGATCLFLLSLSACSSPPIESTAPDAGPAPDAGGDVVLGHRGVTRQNTLLLGEHCDILSPSVGCVDGAYCNATDSESAKTSVCTLQLDPGAPCHALFSSNEQICSYGYTCTIPAGADTSMSKTCMKLRSKGQ